MAEDIELSDFGGWEDDVVDQPDEDKLSLTFQPPNLQQYIKQKMRVSIMWEGTLKLSARNLWKQR